VTLRTSTNRAAVPEAMRETEAAFYYEDFDKAEHLAKVTAAIRLGYARLWAN